LNRNRNNGPIEPHTCYASQLDVAVVNAPIKVLLTLAHDDEIKVARPVLTHSTRLGAEDLVAVATAKSQNHLLAISERRRLDAIVTDVFLNRGNREVVKSLVENPGAQFSAALNILLSAMGGDEMLAEKFGQRVDIPTAVFEQLFWQVRTSVWEQEQAREKRSNTRRLTLTAGVVEISHPDQDVDCVILELAKGGACILVPNGGVSFQRRTRTPGEYGSAASAPGYATLTRVTSDVQERP
jgi:hypothetical protein